MVVFTSCGGANVGGAVTGCPRGQPLRKLHLIPSQVPPGSSGGPANRAARSLLRNQLRGDFWLASRPLAYQRCSKASRAVLSSFGVRRTTSPSCSGRNRSSGALMVRLPRRSSVTVTDLPPLDTVTGPV